MTSILILEDMPDTQHWLEAASKLAFPDSEIDIVNSLEKARTLLSRKQFSLALLDLQLPDGNGIELLPDIRKTQDFCLNIIVTIYDDEAHLLPSLRAGAHGYILKDQNKDKIARMLQQAFAGELALSPKVAKMVLQQFSIPEKSELPITSREIEVLTLIAHGKSTPEVANELSLSKYTVEDHIKNIYRKLDINNRSEAVIIAHKFGLI